MTLHSDVVVAALRELAHSGDKAVLIHCTAGKDRTGIVVALALLAVGVDRETVDRRLRGIRSEPRRGLARRRCSS